MMAGEVGGGLDDGSQLVDIGMRLNFYDVVLFAWPTRTVLVQRPLVTDGSEGRAPPDGGRKRSGVEGGATSFRRRVEQDSSFFDKTNNMRRSERSRRAEAAQFPACSAVGGYYGKNLGPGGGIVGGVVGSATAEAAVKALVYQMFPISQAELKSFGLVGARVEIGYT